MQNGPIDLSKTPIHLASISGAQGVAEVLTDFAYDGPSFENYVATKCTSANPGRLMMVETTPIDWGTWECHPEGDEIVVVLKGRGTFIQLIDDIEQNIPVEPGTTVVNPAGVWHTADVEESLQAIYITPCPNTQHRPRERKS